MPKQYCSCGAPNEYSLLSSPPKFCSQCGGLLGIANASIIIPNPPAQQYQAAPQKPLLVAYRGEEDDDYYQAGKPLRIPKKLDIEIIEDAPVQKMTLGSIMRGTADAAIVDKGGKKMSKKARQEKLQEWRSNLQNVTRRGTEGQEGE